VPASNPYGSSSIANPPTNQINFKEFKGLQPQL